MSLSASASGDESDIPVSIVETMRRMGVVGLPRNYEIFYEVMTGSNETLSKEFNALGSHPPQASLDELARKYFAQSSRHAIAEGALDQVAVRAEEILHLVGRERASLEKFGAVLNQTSDGLERRQDCSRDLLRRLVGIVVAATQTTLDHGRQISAAMAEKTAELEKVKARLEEYKRLADTDPLTGIWNRRAFDRELAAIYSDRRAIMFHALILIDIDEFKVFNDSHGHPAGDRILQKVANVIGTRCGDDNFVARTGGEEFAVILDGFSEEAVEKLGEQLRAAIAETDSILASSGASFGPITISLGLCMAADAVNADELYSFADRALYNSKVSGRNRVTCFSKLAGGKMAKNWLLYRSE